MIKLLTEHFRKSSSKSSSRQLSSRSFVRSLFRKSRNKKKSIYFLKQEKNLVINNDTKHENESRNKSTTFEDNSCNKDVYITTEIMDTIIDVVYFVNEKISFNINKISYMTF